MGNFDCLKVKHDERDQFQSDYFGSFSLISPHLKVIFSLSSKH